MKNCYLLPTYFKKIGWMIFPLFLLLSVYVLFVSHRWELDVKVFALFSDHHFASMSLQDILDEIAFLGITVSLLFISFSREKEEDEYISRIRGEALVWAIVVNYIILIVATWLVYGLPYLQVMMYNMFTVLILFVIKFNLALYKLKKSLRNEE